MIKIIIYEDLNNIMDSSNSYCVKSSEEYIHAYSMIQNALYNNNGFEIITRSKYWLKCFEKMQSIYGDEYIEICTYSPKNELSDMLNVKIPRYIDDGDILKSKILGKLNELQISSGMTFEDIIISNYLSPFLATKKFSFANLTNILNNLDFDRYKKNIVLTIVSKVYKRKLETWIEGMKNESEHIILTKFSINPEEVNKEVCQYNLIKNYPKEVIFDVLGEIGRDYINVDIRGMILNTKNIDLSAIKDNIRLFLNSINIYGLEKEKICRIINMTSGMFVDELEFIIDVLRNNTSEVDRRIIYSVKDKFNNIISGSSEYDEIIENIIPPASPSIINKDASLGDKLVWAKKEYLPYRFWMEENNKVDEVVDNISNQFGQWIYENYCILLSERENMIFNAINSIKDNLSEDELSIILIIDNFNYKYVQLLKELFLKENFSNTVDKPLLSMIPSETSVSKSALLRGDAFDYSNKTYDKLCSEWEGFLKRKIKYLSGIGELRSEEIKSADIYIINYLEIDSILHRNQKNFAQSTKSKVKQELKSLVEVMVKYSKRIGYENKVKIYVCSDHGCTKIIKDKENYISKAYYKGKCNDASHRFVTVSDENMSKLSNNIDEFCYLIDKSTYGTKENYLIAKNYYRFLETNENFYVHGGITPEEVIIPFLKFERLNVIIKYPFVKLKLNEFRISVKTDIHIIISNIDEYEITHLEIRILNNNIITDDKVYYVESMEKLETHECIFRNLRIGKDKNNDKLLLNIKFNMLDKKYEKNYELPIIIKSMIKNTMDLEDLF